MRLPRMCSWNSCLTPESRDIAEVLDDPQLHVRCTLHASPDDRKEEYVRLFVSNLRKEDPIHNAYFYKDGANGAAGDKEPDDIFEQVREDDLPRSPIAQDKHEICWSIIACCSTLYTFTEESSMLQTQKYAEANT
ncbi:hypothetical protein Fot_13672 [Forsythia ovata]|uniref:Uncharacterized protein n=1 Tax=Forsythia ovata TaxID=205694 RepID=A0ABD1W462_9LAMI